MRPDRESDAPARALQLVGDLSAGRSCAHHQHRALGQLRGIAVFVRMDLREARVARHQIGNHRVMEGARRHHHAARLDLALGGLDAEARTAHQLLDLAHLDAAADRGIDHPGVVDEVIGDLLLRDEVVGMGAGKLHPGKAVMPGRAVGDQRVPSLGAPALGDAVPLEHEMRNARLAEMLAHGDARLSGTHHERIDHFRRHPCSPSRTPTSARLTDAS